jgi:hypothetical protein
MLRLARCAGRHSQLRRRPEPSRNHMLEEDMLNNDMSFVHLEDRPLLDAAKQLAADERRATAALLRALIEIDTRRLYLGEGCASMFVYCTRVLHLSEGGAYNRIEAARAARTYPLILELFERSAITLTTIRLLAPHLTAENHRTVLAAAQHKAKRDIEALVVTLQPKPDAPEVVRRVPVVPHTTAAPVPVSMPTTHSAPSTPPSPMLSAAVDASRREESSAPPPAPARIAPLSPERYRIQLSVSRETHDRFRRAQALLRHAVPSGDAAEIFDRAITLLVEEMERRRFAETSRPRVSAPAPADTRRTRHIPAVVRRDVWRRDAGRCAFVGREGRCSETAFLEFHHVEPYAAGGEATVANIQLRCRAHNEYEARLFFDDGVVRESRTRWATSLFRNEFEITPDAVAAEAAEDVLAECRVNLGFRCAPTRFTRQREFSTLLAPVSFLPRGRPQAAFRPRPNKVPRSPDRCAASRTSRVVG